MNVLGIETSCDETGLAIYNSERGILAQVLHSQIALHAQYGGVVPELASRDHITKLLPLLESLLEKARLQKTDINAIAYTTGPGLMGALMTGAMFGRSLAYALGVPAIGIHHMEGHLLVPMLADSAIVYPFVALLVSGGHSQLVLVRDFSQYELLGETIDDAAGEAFDKVAKLLNLPYPGGPQIAKLAEMGNPQKIDFPRPMLHQGLNFSFSGLKTAVLGQVQKRVEGVSDADIAASFQAAMVDTLVIKSQRAVKQMGVKQLVIAGGVSANIRLREQMSEVLGQQGIQVFYPPLELCADNGVMIAYAGYQRLSRGLSDDLKVTMQPRWPMTELCSTNH